MGPGVTVADAEQIESVYRKRAETDFLLFVRGLTIPVASGRAEFDAVMADFQRARFVQLEPSLKAVMNGTKPPVGKFWWEATKGASKDSDLAVGLLWLVCFVKRPVTIQVGAADGDQAAEVKQAIQWALHYNPWLFDYVEVQANRVVNRESGNEIKILNADVAGSHGARPDVLVINELSHITKREFAENLMDNAAKVPNALVLVATNAGFRGTWQEVWKKIAETGVAAGEWVCNVFSRPSPWLSDTDVVEAQKRNSSSRFKRLWWGVWASGKGDAFDEVDIDRAFISGLGPLSRPVDGWIYVAGLDLGVSHDHAGFVVLGVHMTERRIRLAMMRAWEPVGSPPEVDLIGVENAVRGNCELFRVAWAGYDPSQAVLMAQRLRRAGVAAVAVPFTGANLDLMANTLKTAIESDVLQLYDDPDGRLRRDLGKMNLVEKRYGYRLEATRDEFGHADVGTAFVIALVRAVEILGGVVGLQPGDSIAVDDDKPLSREEIDGLPAELRDIYDSCAEPVGGRRASIRLDADELDDLE